ncbi:unnamed protein product [Chondrus crispus]|uniref:Uncharacterized protein n=1 Tax=Chondrus crispus TaxID=2769 RepID=R7QD40_CHOCR|nr:unnamed protein product [Chondrus crispus]CDF36422.1 unnamed protein product [Chondrus crispus]|eukprot:XP_005716241.1 unnamed protein product [Chondrus crispus]
MQPEMWPSHVPEPLCDDSKAKTSHHLGRIWMYSPDRDSASGKLSVKILEGQRELIA